MRIARVVTICVALISTFLGVETERTKRRSQPKSQLPQPRIENVSTTPITFTTLRPEVRSFSSQIDASVHPVGTRRRVPRVRFSRFVSIRPKNNRHRRQLHRRGKKSQLGRSFDVSDTQKIEIAHGPPEEIHLEPMYRVTKNNNIFESIIDLIRRLVKSEKALGPLVGPFHFPGVGDKVYVRLLEPALPDHLVIRLVSHLPATEIESAMEKHISPPIKIPKHPHLSSINHESLVLSPNELVNPFSKHEVIAPDSLLSSSDHVVQASKAPRKLGEKLLGNNWANGLTHFSETYSINGQSNSTNDQAVWSPISNRDNWRFLNPVNESIDAQRINKYHDSFNQVYDSVKEPEVLKFTIGDFQDPLNVSNFQPPVESFIPFRDYTSENQFKSNQDSPKYSLDFVSKKMRYLNMDGSVDSSKEIDDGGWKAMEKVVEKGPVLSKVDREWGLVRRSRVRRKEIVGTKNEKGVQERSDSTEAFAELERKSNDDRLDNSTNKSKNDTVTKLKDDGNFGQRHQNESSTNTMKSVVKERSESPKNSTKSRGT